MIIFNSYNSLDEDEKNNFFYGVPCNLLPKQLMGIFLTVNGDRKPICKDTLLNMLSVRRKKFDLIRNQESLEMSGSQMDMKGKHDIRTT